MIESEDIYTSDKGNFKKVVFHNIIDFILKNSKILKFWQSKKYVGYQPTYIEEDCLNINLDLKYTVSCTVEKHF